MGKQAAAVPSDLRADCADKMGGIQPLGAGLPKVVDSLCPSCGEVISGHQFVEDARVLIEKGCPKCGRFTDLVSSSASFFLQMERWRGPDDRGVADPAVPNATRCPADCGLCSMHLSHAVVGLVDLTNRCNLRCPVCFANADAAGYRYEPHFDVVKQMLQSLRNQRPAPCGIIQFSGGEPSLYPRFLDVIRLSRQLGFSQVQVATNGLLFADPAFALRAREAGLDLLYLQFDGVDDDVYRRIRGARLWERKLAVIDSARHAGLDVVLVPTVVKGQNDHQIGDLIRLALANIDVVTGICFQPVVFTGRIADAQRERMRYTLADLARDVETQTGLAKADEDWLPLHCTGPFTDLIAAVSGEDITSITCHAQCAAGTYLFADSRTGLVVPVTRFLDAAAMLPRMREIARSAQKSRFRLYSKARAWRALKSYFHEDKAPPGLTFTRFLKTLQRMTDKRYQGEEKVSQGPESARSYRTLMLAGMHFMDAYNYDIARVRRCVIQYAAPDGMIYPFCAYNSGPTFRTQIEQRYCS